MLYHLLYPLHTDFSLLNVVQYITFRTAAASLTAFTVTLVLGPFTIRRLRALGARPGGDAGGTGQESGDGEARDGAR